MFWKRFPFLLAAVFISLSTSGCAVFMAANQPGKVDEKVLSVGIPRDAVMAELGAPISSEIKEGNKVDVFRFEQGYSTGTKVARAGFHAVADVFTFFLWEVVGTPAEAIYDGKNKAVRVTYDQGDKVLTVVPLTGF